MAGRGLEVHRATIEQGERLFLIPSPDVLEAYLLLEGRLRRDAQQGPTTFGSGDVLVSDGLEREVVLSAETRTTFFYVTSRPTFHEVSERLRTLMELAVEIEIKDGYTAGHCRRLQQLAYATGRELGLDGSRLYLLDHAAYLHDVGKVRVALEVLQKPTSLTAAEWRAVERHPVYGRELLEGTLIAEAGAIVEQHHERLDGSGYPYGLAGDEIAIEAMIVAVADAYDAMTTRRPYRDPVGHEEALAELRRQAGRLFRRDVIEAFAAVVGSVDLERDPPTEP